MHGTQFDKAVAQLLSMLVEFGDGNDRVANPWADCVAELDIPGAGQFRIDNLRTYLRLHRGARFLLVGQEAGYAGCRFSGIAFTGEDLLAGPKTLGLFANHGMHRTSVFSKLMSERSANIVWPCIGQTGRAVLWNSFPFHCHEPGLPLTNRAWQPGDDRSGLRVRILTHLVEKVFPGAKLIAVGKKASASLDELGFESVGVRHPAHGGANLFRAQVAQIFAETGG